MYLYKRATIEHGDIVEASSVDFDLGRFRKHRVVDGHNKNLVD
jgi:hypothetical protein